MTVAGQKNHYYVKLLKGYGVSIGLKDNRLCLKSGRNPFTGEQETEEWFVSQIPYELTNMDLLEFEPLTSKNKRKSHF